jgi:hypothetical protein
MPLTSFQSGVARVLAANRNPESYVAGGAVINRGCAAASRNRANEFPGPERRKIAGGLSS